MEKPILMRWDDDGALRPVSPYFAALADETFVVGDVHPIVEQHMRDAVSHSHYFARLAEMWKTLPDALAAEFGDREKLRKHALIHCGYADELRVVFNSAADAALALAIITPMDEYAICKADGPVLYRWTAKSQAHRAMGKKDFMASKYKVLGWVADQLKLPADDEHRNPGED